ncbi:MAG: type IV pilin, partial [Euryarchaeota archaeon]|nr:type IV pilin [Euryarchaeota archaeon]
MKVMRKEKGVSEVLGSILVLLITVTLFSSVFYYINTIPTPKQGTYSEFNAKIQFFNESGSTYVNITVENVGGESIKVSTTMFIVAIDLSVDRHMLTEFGNQSFVKDGWFSQGESFFYNSSWYGQTATPQSNIEIMLYDTSTQQVIWTAKLHGSYNMPPVLVSVFSNPTPIVLGKYATISAIIFDPDTAQSISDYKVWIDLSSLNESSNVTMTYSSNNLFTTNPIQFTDTSLDVKKAYLVVVHIEDKSGREVSYSAYLYVTRGTSIKGADVFIDPSLVTLSDA